MTVLDVAPRFTPPLDPTFVPAEVWHRALEQRLARGMASRKVAVVLEGAHGETANHWLRIPESPADGALAYRQLERTIKFLLWQRGARRVLVAGAPGDLVGALAQAYGPGGERAFDGAFMGRRVHGTEFSIEAIEASAIPGGQRPVTGLGRHLDGCRIGFDLGGSDRKWAAVVDGEVVDSGELPWDPYFQEDPAYHQAGVEDCLARAAACLPRVDAIGGSAAGIYVDNEVRVASLFRGVPETRFEQDVRPMFRRLAQRWGVPFRVINDGAVTALAGSMSLGDGGVLGVAMGTSQAAGHVTLAGHVSPQLDELAFAPVDYRDDAPRDEWSGDVGCGAQYFSQQAVVRLARAAGFDFPAPLPAPDQLVAVQDAQANGDGRATRIFQTIGTYLGYSLWHYARFYDFRNVLILGRVTSGAGGAVILSRAREVLEGEVPDVSARIRFSVPDERQKRHGQAVAAASLPRLGGATPEVSRDG